MTCSVFLVAITTLGLVCAINVEKARTAWGAIMCQCIIWGCSVGRNNIMPASSSSTFLESEDQIQNVNCNVLMLHMNMEVR